MTWTPPPRAPWVDKVATIGRSLGDGGRSLVSLDATEVITAAEEATGLTDWGDDWFRAPYAALMAALEDEARLHLAGRLRARSEIQRILQNRLALIDLWQREPTVLAGPVDRPVFVTGLGRSGTTLLHELLALDPTVRAPGLWELMWSVPPPRTETYETDARIAAADAEITLLDEMVPAFTAMHENRGHLPTECIFAFAHQLSTDLFTGLWNVPSYVMLRAGLDHGPEYAWHRRTLATLQSAHPGDHWVLKAPSHLSQLPALFAEYPDARVVITHRDPLRVIGSLADLMATLHWMHSDHVDHAAIAELLAFGLGFVMDEVTAVRDAGALPEEQISDVRYVDLVTDPLAVVEALHVAWDRELTAVHRRRIEQYLTARHHGRTPGHDYRFEDTGLTLGEHRPRLAGYQARFDVPSEV